MNFVDPFGLCKDKKSGKERECLVEWLNAGNEKPSADAMATAWVLAQSADVDLGLSNGQRKPRTDCTKDKRKPSSRHHCGLAFDIATVNGLVVGSGKPAKANPEAAELVSHIQATANRIFDVRENFGPAGLWWKGSTFSGSGQDLLKLWAGHQNHIHISIQSP